MNTDRNHIDNQSRFDETVDQDTPEYWVNRLSLEPHPEGGYFAESYRSEKRIDLPQGRRAVQTAIYYLLPEGAFSAFHRLAADEMWHYYCGGTLRLYMLRANRGVEAQLLGLPGSVPDEEKAASGDSREDKEADPVPQIVIPAGVWFAAEPLIGSRYILTGCTVAPGFEYDDFELAREQALCDEYPQHRALIRRLCRK